MFTIEIRFGDCPDRMAATSFSDAARVASPNLVHRYSAQSPAATITTRPARMNLSTGMTTVSLSRTRFCGSIWRDGFWAVPKASSIDAWAMSSTASEETSFASGAAVRSGRNANSSISAPTTDTKIRLMASADTLSREANSPLVSDQKTYPATMAIPPTDRLMMPEPR